MAEIKFEVSDDDSNRLSLNNYRSRIHTFLFIFYFQTDSYILSIYINEKLSIL